MNKTNFTKSPWVLGTPTNHAPFCVDAHCNVDGMLFEVCAVWGVDEDGVACSQSEANANLISKAPELYEMLEKILNSLHPDNELYSEAEQLLAKARGE
jgi:hypothetical protein